MTGSERQSEMLDHGTAEITRIGAEAIALAVEEHRRLGNPIAVWRDGQVVWIPPEEIPPYTPSGAN
jgi:hypothetical protein